MPLLLGLLFYFFRFYPYISHSFNFSFYSLIFSTLFAYSSRIMPGLPVLPQLLARVFLLDLFPCYLFSFFSSFICFCWFQLSFLSFVDSPIFLTAAQFVGSSFITNVASHPIRLAMYPRSFSISSSPKTFVSFIFLLDSFSYLFSPVRLQSSSSLTSMFYAKL